MERRFRIITIEDTPEIPVDTLKNCGFNIQHLRTNTEKGFELNAQKALRTALRLGESVLIIGEVRGPEAKSLFEAMRIGAAGNCVMGTIHGSTPYDTWDRIVNDLGVPPTSFKATDIVISCATIRESENSKRLRRVIRVSEVRKNWTKEPVFLDLAVYNRRNDKMTLLYNNLRKSELVKGIATIKGMTIEQAIKSIKARAVVKNQLVKNKKLSLEESISANEKFLEKIRGL